MKKGVKVFLLVSIIIMGITSLILADDMLQIIHVKTGSLKTDEVVAYNCLRTAEVFTDGSSGVGGSMSEEIKAFKKLFESSIARDSFIKLEQEANIEGKLYALCALYFLDRSYYGKAIEKYKSSNETVKVQGGCMQWSTKLSDQIKEFDESDIPQALKEYIDRDSE